MKKTYKTPEIEIFFCQVDSHLLAGSNETMTGNILDANNQPVDGGDYEYGGEEDGVAGSRGGGDWW